MDLTNDTFLYINSASYGHGEELETTGQKDVQILHEVFKSGGNSTLGYWVCNADIRKGIKGMKD